MNQFTIITFTDVLADLESPIQHLFNDYDKNFRPICDGRPTNVTIDVALRQIIGLVRKRVITTGICHSTVNYRHRKSSLFVNVWLF